MCERCNNCGTIIKKCKAFEKNIPCIPDFDNYCADCSNELKM